MVVSLLLFPVTGGFGICISKSLISVQIEMSQIHGICHTIFILSIFIELEFSYSSMKTRVVGTH